MVYNVTWLPKYESSTPGKYNNWKRLNSPELGIPIQYKFIVQNYQIIQK